MSALLGPAVTRCTWPVEVNPADPGEADDACTPWPHRSTVRNCTPRPNLLQAHQDAVERWRRPIRRKR